MLCSKYIIDFSTSANESATFYSQGCRLAVRPCTINGLKDMKLKLDDQKSENVMFTQKMPVYQAVLSPAGLVLGILPGRRTNCTDVMAQST